MRKIQNAKEKKIFSIATENAFGTLKMQFLQF